MNHLPLTSTCFGGSSGEACNALRSALTTAAKRSGHKGEYAEYDYLARIARTSLIVELVDALKDHGYCITKLP